MSTESERLLPCPFCGEEGRVRSHEPRGGVGFNVSCQNGLCQTEGPWALAESDAIAAWNRRAQPAEPEPVGEREQVATSLRYLADRAEHTEGQRLYAEDAPLFRMAAELISALRPQEEHVFTCPACGDPAAQVVGGSLDIHAGATYECDRCGKGVIFEALTPEQYVERVRPQESGERVPVKLMAWMSAPDGGEPLLVVETPVAFEPEIHGQEAVLVLAAHPHEPSKEDGNG